MLYVDKNGWISNPLIFREERSAIEQSQSGNISAIVLHRTGSANASSVLNAWKTQKQRTHFLISENSKIFQTAIVKTPKLQKSEAFSLCVSKGEAVVNYCDPLIARRLGASDFPAG
jgi:hypothetical protein